MSQDPELRAHQEWLGYLQPVGLVVSPAALRDSQAHVNKNIVGEQEILLSLAQPAGVEFGKRGEEPPKRIRDFPALAQKLLAWEPTDLAGGPGGPDLPASLETPLADYGETLKPTYAVPDAANAGGWLMLIKVIGEGIPLDVVPEAEANDKRWQASPQARFERLLRENQVPIGLLSNGDVVRLVYSPRGESTGHLTFPVAAMCEVPGRPILAALHMLLSAERLFVVPSEQRLPALLQKSRKYQNEVSTKLAEQVLRALNELMRGFQSANEATQGELLRQVLREAPEDVYGGLLTTLMRLVFILYAEDRGLLSNEPFYVESYSISGLFERLREDDAQFPDTMDQRFGAWAQILTLSRLIHDGGGHGRLNLPARRGRLFDPDAYPFLEGRPFRSKRSSAEPIYPPRVSDGVIFRVLQDLLLLDGDRLSYRSLDVEQIGSVYEAMMGFVVQTAAGPSVGLKPDHVVVNLSELLGKSGADRLKWLKEHASADVTGRALEQLKTAGTIDDLVAAFGRKISPLYLDGRGLPLVISGGGMYLQPTEERRRSGSHYTPRSLTEPIVRTTLHPILTGLGEKPRPEQILGLKVCDPAMGSGAFLVESCRYLAEALVESWSVYGDMPIIPPDQEPILHARRLIAQRCLYGVDKNPFAVDLAKLSLWLTTLAKDHPFTFLDHSLRCGDSLVGLSRQQIAGFHWLPAQQRSFLEQELRKRIERVSEFRQRILAARDEVPYEQLRQQLDRAEDSVFPLRQAGDAVIAAFFSADISRRREQERGELQSTVESAFKEPGRLEYETRIETSIHTLVQQRLAPFHWHLEFPEVFHSDQGFDCFVGNPPFLGGRKISGAFGKTYVEYLSKVFPGAANLCDLVAYFFRRAYSLLSATGTLGLLATKTIAAGDTRTGGLAHIVESGGTIYAATRRIEWPGEATVIVSAVHIAARPLVNVDCLLDGKPVEKITSFLFSTGGDSSPMPLRAHAEIFSQGSKIYGQGFLFDDQDEKASPISEMASVLTSEPQSKLRIFPYIGGDETTSSAVVVPARHVINLSDIKSEEELAEWPILTSIVRRLVKPYRDSLPDTAVNRPLRRRWWAYQAHRPNFYAAARQLPRILSTKEVSTHLTFVFLPTTWIYSHKLNLFLLTQSGAFAVLQSRVHEVFVRAFSSSRGDGINYSCSDCFETYPFPPKWIENVALERIGDEYYQFRAELMIRNDEGPTKTYNRFHDKYEDDAGIRRLRDLHAEIDRAVLDAYGWTDLSPSQEFILDYQEPNDEDSDGGRKRREPWRYRWPDEFRDEVVARLLQLNRDRAEEERLACCSAEAISPSRRATRSTSPRTAVPPTLFGSEDLPQ